MTNLGAVPSNAPFPADALTSDTVFAQGTGDPVPLSSALDVIPGLIGITVPTTGLWIFHGFALCTWDDRDTSEKRFAQLCARLETSQGTPFAGNENEIIGGIASYVSGNVGAFWRGTFTAGGSISLKARTLPESSPSASVNPTGSWIVGWQP